MIKQKTPVTARRDIKADSATSARPILSPRLKHTIDAPLELLKEMYSSAVQVVPSIEEEYDASVKTQVGCGACKRGKAPS